MKNLLSLCTIVCLLPLAGCGGGGEDPVADFNEAKQSLETGQGVADAPSYQGGSIPHKLAGKGTKHSDELGATPDTFEGLPYAWVAHSIPELQLYLKVIWTYAPTGRTHAYYTPSGVATLELLHTTVTYTLLEAQTAAVLATEVLTGDNQFPSSRSVTGGGGTTIPDTVPAFSVTEWVRPFVER